MKCLKTIKNLGILALMVVTILGCSNKSESDIPIENSASLSVPESSSSSIAPPPPSSSESEIPIIDDNATSEDIQSENFIIDDNTTSEGIQIVFVTDTTNKRISFSTESLDVGSEDDLKKWSSTLQETLLNLGTCVIYNGVDGPRKYTKDFIEGYLKILKLTRLTIMDEINVQDPAVFGRGLRAASVYDKDGNKLWTYRIEGRHFAVELADSGDVNVFQCD